ncbi:FAD-binding oxidoreductase [Candidatus Saccharibacteria bacterium]|nr:MAG: FAD-binding oxidoreductase [Candidatus Saccharibacteria bacterium]
MSKIASYLSGHLAGEVSTRSDVREAISTDLGILKLKPDMVIYPRNTNDIRKVCRFAWQLAEKGHTLPVTVRGAGTDSTGAALGKGAAVVMTAHMNRIFEYEPKQKLVRLQPGVAVGALQQSLALHGTSIMPLVGSHAFGTVGGAVANAVAGLMAGKYGTVDKAVDQLEVVLASGDVIQTGRINKRELSRRKGMQGFVGDIYRGIDAIIEENTDLLDTLRANDATGYNTIADVKQKDGSFDLTPLFIGSQGTLGIITEMIMRGEFRSLHMGVAAMVFASSNTARDALDELCSMTPAFVEYFDAELFETAAKCGRQYEFYKRALDEIKAPASVVIVGFDEFSDRVRAKRLKKVVKTFAKYEDVVFSTADGDEAQDMLAALDVTYYTALPGEQSEGAPGIFTGFHVPTERLEDFAKSVDLLAQKHHIALPLAGHVYTNTYGVYPTFDLHKVGDKQTVLKLLDALTQTVYSHGGTMVAEGGEGRLKSRFIYNQLDARIVKLYQEVRKVCDPHGYMNSGVKESIELRHLAEMIRDSHDAGQFARFGL